MSDSDSSNDSMVDDSGSDISIGVEDDAHSVFSDNNINEDDDQSFFSEDEDGDDSESESDSSTGSFISIGVNDLPAHLRQEETSFDDEEDTAAFRGVSKFDYMQIRYLKEGNDGTSRFFHYFYHSRLGDGGKARLGRYLAGVVNQSDLDRIILGDYPSGPLQVYLTFEEERPQSVGQVFQGPFERDHALRRFKISAGENDLPENITIPLDDWRCLSQYLRAAPSLRHLDLADLSMGREELELLASAVQGAKLKTLSLKGLTDEYDSLRVLLASIDPSKLETIDIVGCDVGVAACEGLASILRNEETTLEILNLDGNPIDDDCVRVLCESLAGNKSLKTLHLNDMDDITMEGWKLFDKLIFDTSNLNTLYQSNHTLERVAGYPRTGFFKYNRMKFNKLNEGQSKIIRFLTRRPGRFDIEPLVDIDTKMMPFALHFFQNFSHPASFRAGELAHLSYTYNIIRHWNMPILFSFPSAEKMRLSARMNELETKNRDLLREIEDLRSEVSKLSTEITQLKSEKQSTGEMDPKLKRARPN